VFLRGGHQPLPDGAAPRRGRVAEDQPDARRPRPRGPLPRGGAAQRDGVDVGALTGARRAQAEGVTAHHDVVAVDLGAQRARGDLLGVRDQAHRPAREQTAQSADADRRASAGTRAIRVVPRHERPVPLHEPSVRAVQPQQTPHLGLPDAVLREARPHERGELRRHPRRGGRGRLAQRGPRLGEQRHGRLDALPPAPQRGDPADHLRRRAAVARQREMTLVALQGLRVAAEPVQRQAAQPPGALGAAPDLRRRPGDRQGEAQPILPAGLQRVLGRPQQGVEGVGGRGARIGGHGARGARGGQGGGEDADRPDEPGGRGSGPVVPCREVLPALTDGPGVQGRPGGLLLPWLEQSRQGVRHVFHRSSDRRPNRPAAGRLVRPDAECAPRHPDSGAFPVDGG